MDLCLLTLTVFFAAGLAAPPPWLLGDAAGEQCIKADGSTPCDASLINATNPGANCCAPPPDPQYDPYVACEKKQEGYF